MASPLLLVDITELLRNPIRTGIQRVVREILNQWPASVPHQVVCFDSVLGGFRFVPLEIVDYCANESAPPYGVAEMASLISASLASWTVDRVELRRGDRVLVPELFAALDRLQFYRQLQGAGVEVLPIVFDLLAWTAPDALNISYVGGLNDYLGFLFSATKRCFISRSVHDIFCARFLRGPGRGGDAVIPLGADSLPRTRDPAKRSWPYFVCVGALDGRKGQEMVYRAFLASGARDDFELLFLGRVPPAPRPAMRALVDSQERGIVVIDDPDDQLLASLISGARASLFVSRHEGFGLPAVESLYLGTPVVVADDLPAVSNLGTEGQIRLRGESQGELVEAFDLLTQAAHADRLRIEAAGLNLPTWSDYARSVATWASA